jgi:hypothetical protein
MWFLSDIGEMPTPNVRSDVWNHVEFYTILMLLACRLKIIPTSNLKLVISFLVLLILVLSLFKLLSLVASTRHAALNLACLLEVGQQA